MAFLGAKEQVEVDLASLFSQQLAQSVEKQCQLGCNVETELFLIAPKSKHKEANVIKVTEDNCSECFSILRDSEVFEFGPLFREYQFNPGRTMARGEQYTCCLMQTS